MSTLTVTTVQTANGTTNLVLKTGNSSITATPYIDASNGRFNAGSPNFNEYAILGYSNNQPGIYGWSNNYIGVYGYANTSAGGTLPAYGLYGFSNTGWGAVLTAGMAGTQATGGGLYCQSNGGTIANFVNTTASVASITNTAMTVAPNTFNLGTSSIASTGYSRLPNGLLMQWGNNSANTTTTAINFPIAFSTLYSITCSGTNDTGKPVAIIAANNTTFTPRTSATTNPGLAFYYMAIGV